MTSSRSMAWRSSTPLVLLVLCAFPSPAVAQKSGTGERDIREWFDRKLITPEGIRGQVLMGAEHSDGLSNHAIPHRLVAPLPLIPHPHQCRVPGIDKINNANVRFGGVFTMQPASILLQRALP